MVARDAAGCRRLAGDQARDERFPDTALAALGYRSVFAGQKTYNGVAILARGLAIEDVQVGIPGFEDEQRRVIAATVGGVRIVDFYVVNGQAVGSEKFEYKLRWLKAARAMLAAEIARHPQLVVLGDFNIAPTDLRRAQPEALARKDHVLDTRARGVRRHRVAGTARQLPAALQRAGTSFVVGLPAAGVRSRLGTAHRPGADLRGIARPLHGGRHRSRAADWERPSDHAPVWVELAR